MGFLGASRLPRSLSEPARLQIPFDPEFPVHLRLLRLRSPFAFLHVCRYVGKPRAAPCSILPASSGPRRPKTSSSFAVRFTSPIPRLLPPTRRERTPPHNSGRADLWASLHSVRDPASLSRTTWPVADPVPGSVPRPYWLQAFSSSSFI